MKLKQQDEDLNVKWAAVAAKNKKWLAQVKGVAEPPLGVWLGPKAKTKKAAAKKTKAAKSRSK